MRKASLLKKSKRKTQTCEFIQQRFNAAPQKIRRTFGRCQVKAEWLDNVEDLSRRAWVQQTFEKIKIVRYELFLFTQRPDYLNTWTGQSGATLFASGEQRLRKTGRTFPLVTIALWPGIKPSTEVDQSEWANTWGVTTSGWDAMSLFNASSFIPPTKKFANVFSPAVIFSAFSSFTWYSGERYFVFLKTVMSVCSTPNGFRNFVLSKSWTDTPTRRHFTNNKHLNLHKFKAIAYRWRDTVKSVNTLFAQKSI